MEIPLLPEQRTDSPATSPSHPTALVRLALALRALFYPELNKLDLTSADNTKSSTVSSPIPLGAVPTVNGRPPIQGESPKMAQKEIPRQQRGQSKRGK